MMQEAAAAYVVAEQAERRQQDLITRMSMFSSEIRRLQRREQQHRAMLREAHHARNIFVDANTELANENRRLTEAVRNLTGELDQYRAQTLAHMRTRRIPQVLAPYILRRRERLPHITRNIQQRQMEVTELENNQMEVGNLSDSSSAPESDLDL